MNEQRQFTIFHAPLLSFFSSELYRDVAYRWKGYGIAYLCILTLFFIMPETIQVQKDLNEYVDTVSPKIISQFPELQIKAGILHMNAPSPHKIYYKDEKKPLIIIDTSKTYQSEKDANVLIYLTEKTIFFKRMENDYVSVELSKFDDIVITHETLAKWVQMFKQTFVFFFTPLIYFFSLLYFLAQVILCASLGLLISRKICPELNYSQLMRLSAISFTPPVILLMLHTILEIEFAYSGPVTLFFALCYLYFGLRSASEKNTTNQHNG